MYLTLPLLFFASSALFASLRFNRFQDLEEGAAREAAFVVEEPAFDVGTPQVARQAAVAAENAVAWDDDRDRVTPDRATDRLRAARPTEGVGEIAVRDGIAIRNFEERLPDALLKWRPGEVEREVKCPSRAVQIFGELACCIAQCTRVRHEERGRAILPECVECGRHPRVRRDD